MAQLLLITEKSLSVNDNRQVGDIVGIFDDTHVFSPKELELFSVVKIDGDRQTAELIRPTVRTVYKAKSTEWELEPPQEAQAWRDVDGSYKQIVDEPRLEVRYEDGQIKENYSRDPINRSVTLISADSPIRES